MIDISSDSNEYEIDNEYRQSKSFLTVAAAISVLAMYTLSVSTIVAIPLVAATLGFCYLSAVSYLKASKAWPQMQQTIEKIHSLSIEVFHVINSSLLFGFTFLKRCHNPKEIQTGTPVLFIHGYGSYGSTWLYHKKKIDEAGLGPLYSVNLGTGDSIKTYAQQIQQTIEKIQKETGKNEITLVGHSRGGLVASYFALHLADKITCKVRDVITICSPFKGTATAEYGFGADAREMRINSIFLKHLREDILQQKSIRFSHIYSTADETVSGISASFEENDARRKEFKGLGHTSVLFSSQVSDQLIHWIDEIKPEERVRGAEVTTKDKRKVFFKKGKQNSIGIKSYSFLASLFKNTVSYRTDVLNGSHMETWYLDKKECIRWIRSSARENLSISEKSSAAEIRKAITLSLS